MPITGPAFQGVSRRAGPPKGPRLTRALALLLALVSGPQGPPPPAQGPPPVPVPAAVGPRRVDASRFGVVADGKSDCSAALQRAVDALPAGGVVDLPPGLILTRWPVYFDRSNLHLRGAGRGVTTLKPQYGQVPPLVFGVRRTELGGQAVTDAHRPDAFGLLDATVARRPGLHRGYSTLGNSSVMAVFGPPQLGRISPASGSRVFDGYGSMDGLTVEAAVRFRGGFPKNQTLAGLGDSRNPGPWWVGFDGEGLLTVTFRCSDDGGSLNDPVRVFRARLKPSDAVVRLRVWLRFVGDGVRVGVAADGVDLPLEGLSRADGFPRLARNLGQYPFTLGPGAGPTIGSLQLGPVPDFDVLGFRVSSEARTVEPPDDKARYVPDAVDPTAVFWLDGQGPTARHVEFGCGLMTGVPVCVGFVNSTGGTLGGLDNCSVSDLTVDGGGILVGQVLDFSARDVESVNGFVGVGSYPLGMNYPVALDGCRLSGYHAGLSLTRSFAWIRNVDVVGSGAASMIFTGCNARVENALFSHFSPEAESCVLILPDEAGGRTVLENLEVDDEELWLPSAVKCHLAPYGPSTYLSVRSLAAAQIAAGRPVIDLVGSSVWPGTLDAYGVVATVGSVPASVGKGWTATVGGVPVKPAAPADGSAP